MIKPIIATQVSSGFIMFQAKIRVLLLLAFFGGTLSQNENVVIEISDGQIRGNVRTTTLNTVFHSFQGIRYGEPPVGRLRFQAPVPVKPWSDIYDATNDRYQCYQTQSDNNKENEDCLFLNVYTPKVQSSPLPVLVYFYGGAFLDGAAETDNYGPYHFMEYDVILVTLNYRVGIFGFASTGDDEIPGNAGLKDQNLALQWVQKNIQYFGGDPSKVTIFGGSAGAASVGYQILSPKSKGLFRAAIAESGSSLSPWAYQRRQVEFTRKSAGYINSMYGQSGISSNQLLQFLQNVPAKDLDSAQAQIVKTDGQDNYSQMLQGFFFGPVLEHEHAGAFVTKLQYESFAKGDFNQVPLIIGFNSEESLFYADNQNTLNWLAGNFDKDHTSLVPEDMRVTNNWEKQQAGDEIYNIYVPGSSFQQNTMSVVKYHSDHSFIKSVIKHAELQSAYNDVYLYRFAYHGTLGGYTSQSVPGFSDSVTHSEDLSYLFSRGPSTIDLSKFPESDRAVQKRFITWVTNFAKYLNPTPQADPVLENIIWPKVNTADVPYLDIGSSSLVREHPRDESYRKWQQVYDKHGVPPYDSF